MKLTTHQICDKRQAMLSEAMEKGDKATKEWFELFNDLEWKTADEE